LLSQGGDTACDTAVILVRARVERNARDERRMRSCGGIPVPPRPSVRSRAVRPALRARV